jgi:hypothetical protein
MHGVVLDLKPVLKAADKVEKTAPLSDITTTVSKKTVTFKMGQIEQEDNRSDLLD